MCSVASDGGIDRRLAFHSTAVRQLLITGIITLTKNSSLDMTSKLEELTMEAEKMVAYLDGSLES